MGFFDFLKGSDPGIQQGAMIPGSDQQTPGGIFGPPTATPAKPGLLERFNAPNEGGISWADKLYAAGASLNGQNGMEYLSGLEKNTKQQAALDRARQDQAKKNAAFKAAYVLDPKTGQHRFDPAAYAGALGDAGGADLGDMASAMKAFAPEKQTVINTADGLVDPHAEGGPRLIYPVEHKLPNGFKMGENGPEIDMDWVKLQGMISNARAGAVAAHRAPRAAGGGAGAIPPPPPGPGLVRIIK